MQTLMSNRHWDTGVWITQEGSGVDIQIQQGASGSQDHKTEKGRLACRMRREAAVGRTLWGSEGLGGKRYPESLGPFLSFPFNCEGLKGGDWICLYSLCPTSLHWAWLRVGSTQCLLADGRNGCPFSLFLLQIWGV